MTLPEDQAATRRRLAAGVAALGAAVVTVVFGQLQFDDAITVTLALVFALVALGVLGSLWQGWSSALAAVGVGLILLAIYLPAIGADGAIAGWLGDDAGAADRLDVVALARWVLVVAGVVLVLWPGRAVALEAVLTTIAMLALVAVVASVIDLGARVTTPDKAETAKADLSRSFALAAEKVQSIPGDLAADACVNVVLVIGVDDDTADAGNALTFTHKEYAARLPAKLAAGKPETAVKVELQQSGQATEFATNLTAATAAYVLGARESSGTTAPSARPQPPPGGGSCEG